MPKGNPDDRPDAPYQPYRHVPRQENAGSSPREQRASAGGQGGLVYQMATAQPPAGVPALELTDLTLKESVPVVVGFILVLPLLAAPFLGSMLLRTSLGFKIGIIRRLASNDAALSGMLEQTPWLEDAAVAFAIVAVVLILCGLLGVPLFGSFSPLVKATQRMRPRTGVAFDFPIKDPGRPHRLALEPLGSFTGYPGEALISVRLDLPDTPPLEAERSFRAITQSKGGRSIAEYMYDPIYYQFTPPHAGPAHLWIGYGNGPETRMTVAVNRRS